MAARYKGRQADVTLIGGLTSLRLLTRQYEQPAVTLVGAVRQAQGKRCRSRFAPSGPGWPGNLNQE